MRIDWRPLNCDRGGYWECSCCLDRVLRRFGAFPASGLVLQAGVAGAVGVWAKICRCIPQARSRFDSVQTRN